MVNISQKVLGKLKRYKTKPLPAWRFTMRAVIAWIGFFIFVVLGAHAVSMVLFLLSAHDWTRLSSFRGGPGGYLLRAVPMLWLAILLILLVAAYLDFRRTKTGYRYQSFAIIGALVGVSLIGGVALHAAGVSRQTDDRLNTRFPRYRMLTPRGEDMWHHPDEGMIFGEVTEIIAVDQLRLKCRLGEELEIKLPSNFTGELPAVGDRLRVIGDFGEDGLIEVEAVLPWRPGFFGGQRPSPCPMEEDGCLMRSKDERSMRPPGAPGRSRPKNNFEDI